MRLKRPREFATVKLRREDWQQVIDACAGHTEIDDDTRRRLVVGLFIYTGIDPTVLPVPTDES